MSEISDSEGRPAERVEETRRNAVRSTVWIGVGFGGGQVVKLVSSIVLTRLVHPEVYGLMDLVLVLSVALYLFSDIGITPCVVQNPRGEERRFLDTAWTVQVLRGALLCAATWILAWPVSVVYGRPILAPLLLLTGVSAFLDGLTSPSVFVLSRRLQRGPLVVMDLATNLVVFLLTLVAVYAMDPDGVHRVFAGETENLAYNEQLAWAVALAWLGGRIFFLLLSHFAVRGPRARLAWDRSALREIIGFGKWIFLTTTLTFFAMHFDRMIVPKMIDFEAAGLYGRALGLTAIGTGVLGTFTSSVVFPYASRLHERGEPLGQSAVRLYISTALLGSVMISGLVACGPAVTRVIYPVAFADVGWLVQLVAIGAWLGVQASLSGNMLLGYGQRRALAIPMVGKVCALLLFVWPATELGRSFGWNPLAGLILGLTAAEFVRYFITSVLASRLDLPGWKHDLWLALLVIVISWLGISSGAWLDQYLFGIAAPESRWHWLRLMMLQAAIVTSAWGFVAASLLRAGWVRFR